MAQLRVGVSDALVDADPSTGHGRVWSSTLAELRNHVRLVTVPLEGGSGGDYRVTSKGCDVWLASGHAGRAHANVPVVATVHEVGWTPAQLRGLDDSGFSQPLASRTAAGIASASHVIAPSEASCRQVIDRCGMAPERVHLVAPGVDTAVFQPAAVGGRSLVARHAETDERPYLLFVGSLLPRKNVFALRDAVSELARRGYPHLLAIVAADPGRLLPSAPREAVAAELPGAPGQVVMIPRPTDLELAGLMAGAEAFCLPSLGEGFGLPALEAMACGTVVLVSDRGALPEVVGDSGLVVPPTADALEEALRRVFDRPEDFASLRQRAVARARRFGWDRTARGWARVLDRAASEPRRWRVRPFWRRRVRRRGVA
jgi:glycosyltransferase involved in cell wall biosynthesis